VKLRPGSAAAQDWILSGRQGAIHSLDVVVGTHTTEGYIQDATLRSLAAADMRRTTSIAPPPASKTFLDLIAVVHYDANIDPVVASRKLAGHADLVYAEPLYIKELAGVPNDPLFASQYHLSLIKAPQAWDLLPTTNNAVVIGIVDTGIDTTHDDLHDNVWHNPGETGKDAFGKDKRTNGEDDDFNGFIDDWFGWDFAGQNGTRQDNSPLPGHLHGSHVGGIAGAVVDNEIGVAGVARGVKLMSLKVGFDDPNSRSVTRTSDAILYAAANGAHVINCSFGSSSPSFADVDVITRVEELGVVIVAAAGNDGLERDFYPAGHPTVVSVASTDDEDYRSFFSNFSSSVDVSAPGAAILSTEPGNTYGVEQGTSMASPVVAAVAAMTLLRDPSLQPPQVRSLLRANTDNIDDVNPAFIGKIGTGRVNALKTVGQANRRYTELTSIVITDADGDSVFVNGDKLYITIQATNHLDPLVNGRVTIRPAPSTFEPILDVSGVDLGAMSTGETKQGKNAFEIILPNDAPFNAQLSLLAEVEENDTLISRTLITSIINPSYRTIAENDLRLTVNSYGNIGFNDYPDNQQGVGVRYKDSRSYLFEGAFLVGTSPLNLPNVARSADPSYRDNSFRVEEVISIHYDSVTSGLRTVSRFSDANDANRIGLDIRETVYQPTDDSVRGSIIIVYDITNPSDTVISGMHAAMFWDWDIGAQGDADGCAWDHARGIGFIQNTKDASLPTVGVTLLSPMNVDFFAVDNNGSANSPRIFDNFLRAEKWSMMSNGVARTNSSITDVSMMLGGGPFALQPGETRQVSFALAMDIGFDAVADQLASARLLAMDLGLDAVPYDPAPLSDELASLSGGTVQTPGMATARFRLQNPSPVTIELFTLQGQLVEVLFNEFNLSAGSHEREVRIPNVATGVYVMTMRSLGGTSSLTLQIIP